LLGHRSGITKLPSLVMNASAPAVGLGDFACYRSPMSKAHSSLESRLTERVTSQLAPVVGKRLVAVRYWPLKFEMTAADLHGPWHYLGGEVEVTFEGLEPLRITWEESAMWGEYFSVQVARSSAFGPDSLVLLDASASAVWKPVIGEVVSTVEVFGSNTPTVVVLQFHSAAVLVGIGQGSSRKFLYGDGDDVIVMTADEATARGELNNLQSMWRTPSAGTE
jgi:hypothetical protein